MRRGNIGRLIALTLVVAGALSALATPPSARASVRWCGTTESAVDRRPDVVKGYQVHVLYVVPPGGPDVTSQRMSQIASEVAGVDAWWRAQDPTRVPRWDFASFSGCDSTFGNLDISVVRASYTDAIKVGIRGTYTADYSKKYIAFNEGSPGIAGERCGSSETGKSQPGRGFSLAWVMVYPGCAADDLGTGTGFAGYLVAHELLHTLGAPSNPGSPHLCAQDRFHVCDSPSDVMSGFPNNPRLATSTLDAGRDDYYGHGGGWWDVRNSAWLTDPFAAKRALTFGASGLGSGTILWDYPGDPLNRLAEPWYEQGGTCPGDCSGNWDVGSLVFYKPVAAAGSRVAAITGPCLHLTEPLPSGATQPLDWCAARVDGDTTINVSFARVVTVRLTVKLRKGGDGWIRRPSTTGCYAGTCAVDADLGSKLTLKAVVTKGSRFVGWSGSCRGKKSTCVVTVGEATSVVATFEKKPKTKKR